MTKLKNGAMVLQERPYRYEPRCKVVLALWGEEYVTWVVDPQLNACWGHYHQRDLVGATMDYEKRGGGRADA
jgi:hypothetical protein